jgi:hypothetical protein
MRLGLGFSIAVVCSVSVLACKSESDPPIYLDANYQLRCLDCQGRSDDPEREITYLDGEFDFKISCEVRQIGGERSMNLEAQYQGGRSSERYGLRILRANIEEREQNDECRVRVHEGDNTYEGACTGETPSGEAPCQVSFERKNEIVEGSLYCDRIPNLGNLSTYRYLVEPGSMNRAAKFEVHNCEGL